MRGERRRLPDRRKSWTQSVQITDAHGEPQRFYLTVGLYKDGRPGEIFLVAAREGTFTRGVLDDLARTVSLALQCGVDLEALVGMLRYSNYPPNGRVSGSPNVSECTSVGDWVAQELEAAFLTRPQADPPAVKPEPVIDPTELVPAPVQPRPPSPPAPAALVAVGAAGSNGSAAWSPEVNVQNSRALGYTGNPCPRCQSYRTVRNGACLMCLTCSESSGCS